MRLLSLFHLITGIIGIFLLLLVTATAPSNASFLDAYTPVWADFTSTVIYGWTIIPIIFGIIALFFLLSKTWTRWISLALQLSAAVWISRIWLTDINNSGISAGIVALYLLAGGFFVVSSVLTLTTKYKESVPS